MEGNMDKFLVILGGLLISFVLGALYYRSLHRVPDVAGTPFGLYVHITKMHRENGDWVLIYDTNSFVHASAIARMQRILIAQELLKDGLERGELERLFSMDIAPDIGPYPEDIAYIDTNPGELKKTMFPDLSFKDVAVGFRGTES